MRSKIKQLWSDRFVRGTFFLTGAGFFGSVLNYLVHPILTRQLSVAAYGDFQALLSFITVLGIAGAVVYTTLTKEISALAVEQAAMIPGLRRKAARNLSLIGLALFLLVLFFSGPLHDLFNISRVGILLISSIGLLYNFPLIVNRSVLSSLQHFFSLAFLSLCEPLSRVLLIVLLVVYMQMGIDGAAWALGLTSVVSLILSFWAVHRLHLSEEPDKMKYPWHTLGRYALLVLWFMGLAHFFYNFDMLFIKSNFSPDEAGFYGALLTIGRIIYFVGGSISIIMFPVVAGLRADTTTRRFSVLLKSLGLMSLLTIPAYLVIAFFPAFVIRLVVGVKYLVITPYLPLFALAMLLLTLLNVLSQFFLALSRRRGLVVLSGAAVIEIVFLVFWHADFWQVIWTLIITFGFSDIALVVLLLFEYRRTKKGLKITSGHELSPIKTELL